MRSSARVFTLPTRSSSNCASAAASSSPKFTPCPASGCTTCGGITNQRAPCCATSDEPPAAAMGKSVAHSGVGRSQRTSEARSSSAVKFIGCEAEELRRERSHRRTTRSSWYRQRAAGMRASRSQENAARPSSRATAPSLRSRRCAGRSHESSAVRPTAVSHAETGSIRTDDEPRADRPPARLDAHGVLPIRSATSSPARSPPASCEFEQRGLQQRFSTM